MKKHPMIAAVLLAALSLASAQAEPDLSGYAVADGTVTASAWTDLTAPYSGTLYPFSVEAGDTVQAGETVFEMMTTDITAPEAGTVGAVFVEAGDSADAVMQRYGSVAAVRPESRQILNCTYSGAYTDEDDCLLVHLGETLYFQSKRSGKTEGTGTVVTVSDKGYVVEIETGTFKLNETMGLFRDAEYSSKQKVGTGRVANRGDVTVSASGRVAEVFVKAGDTVAAGSRLFSVMAKDADPGTVPTVTAPEDAVVAAVAVTSGQQVWKGELLARLYAKSDAVVEADVDEMYLGGVSVGGKLYVRLDADEETVYEGTVTEISELGHTKQNAAYYRVRVALPGAETVFGQSASVYLPRN